MSTADHILNQIDQALDDWTVSGDAMRSRPAAEPQGPRVWLAPAGTEPDGDGWQEVGYLTSIDLEIDQATIDPAALTTPEPTVTWQELSNYIAEVQAERARRAQQLIQEWVRAFTESIQAAQPRVEEAGRAIAEYAKAVEQAAPPQPPGRRHDRPAWQSPYGPAQRRR